MVSRMASINPPGVLRRTSKRSAFSCLACAMAARTISAVIGMHHAIHVHRDDFGSRGQGRRGERQRDHRNYADSQSNLTIHYSDTVVRKHTMVMRLIESFDAVSYNDRLK